MRNKCNLRRKALGESIEPEEGRHDWRRRKSCGGSHDCEEGALVEEGKLHKEGTMGKKGTLRTPLVGAVVARITATVLKNQRSPPRRMSEGRAFAVSVLYTISIKSRGIRGKELVGRTDRRCKSSSEAGGTTVDRRQSYVHPPGLPLMTCFSRVAGSTYI